MATLTVQTIASTGLVPSYAAAAVAGDKFLNDGRTFIQIKNTNAATRLITITAQKTSTTKPGFGPLTVSNYTYTIAATTGDVMLGAFPQAFNDGDGNVNVTYEAVTNVSIGAFKLPLVA